MFYYDTTEKVIKLCCDDGFGNLAYVDLFNFWSREVVNGYLYPTTLTDFVGIGTQAPSVPLEIYDDDATAFKVRSGALGGVGSGTIQLGSGSVASFLRANIPGGPQTPSVDVGTSSNHNLRLLTNNTERMTIRTNGNINIGNPGVAPTNLLEVRGRMGVGANFAGTQTAKANGLLVEGDVGIGIASPSAGLHVEGDTTSDIVSLRNTFDWDYSILIFGDGGDVEYGNPGAWDYPNLLSLQSTTRDLVLRPNSSENLRIKWANGRVGVGTNNPRNRLDVEGGIVVGATYSGTNTAPTNGLIVEGNVGI